MLNVIMLNVIMLSVVAPLWKLDCVREILNKLLSKEDRVSLLYNVYHDSLLVLILLRHFGVSSSLFLDSLNILEQRD
jgi:hypothetical protein